MRMMRMDTWIVLVCAFDFSVIFQYCTSGFSSGQGPGGLARKRAASWCHGCSDGGLSKTWRCRDRVRSSMCLSNIDVEYPGISTTLATSRRSLETRAREQGQARNGCSLVEGDWNLSRWDCFQRVFKVIRNISKCSSWYCHRCMTEWQQIWCERAECCITLLQLSFSVLEPLLKLMSKHDEVP